jgi:group I intron endonuclease
MNKRHHIIYKTTNRITGKFYIGMHSTDDLLDGYLGSGVIVLRSIGKYGEENHSREILAIANSRDELKLLEADLVNAELLSDPNCMNIAFGGHGATLGIEVKEETRIRMSTAKTGVKNPNFGKAWTDERKARSSLANKGQKRSSEARTKMSEAAIGRDHSNQYRATVVDGVEYESLSVATKTTGINRTTIMCRIRSASEKFKDTYYKDEPK